MTLPLTSQAMCLCSWTTSLLQLPVSNLALCNSYYPLSVIGVLATTWTPALAAKHIMSLQISIAKRNSTQRWVYVSLTWQFFNVQITQMTKYEIIFYNALLVLVPTLCWTVLLGDFSKVNTIRFSRAHSHVLYRSRSLMNGVILSSCLTFLSLVCWGEWRLGLRTTDELLHVCRFVLIYSQILVTQLTSPLTLAVIGCIKVRNPV